jgi:hypothetical protein
MRQMAVESRRRVIEKSSRYFFYLQAAVCIPLGTAMYLESQISSAFWPYPVKPLAFLMFGSMFVAIGLAGLLALRDRSGGSEKAVLVTSWPIFLTVAIAGAIASGFGMSFWTWALSAFLLAMAVAGFLLFVRKREEAMGPTERIPRGLKRAFLGHAIIVAFFGLNMFFLPSLAFSFWPWKVSSTVMRGLGALFLGTAVGTGWAYRQRYLESVRALLLPYFTFVFLVLLDVAANWGVVTAESPGVQVTLFWILVYVYVAVYAAYFLLTNRRSAGMGVTGKV